MAQPTQPILPPDNDIRARLKQRERDGAPLSAERMRLATACLHAGRFGLGAELLAPLMSPQAKQPAACALMGDLQVAAGNASKAETAYRLSLDLDLRQPATLVKLAELYHRLGRYDEAKALVHEALAQKEDDARGYFILSQIHGSLGEHAECITALELAMAVDPANPMIGSAWVLRHAYLPGSGDAELLRAGREWERRYTAHLRPLPPAPAEPLAGRRVRIAYLSPDFRRHSTAYFFLPLVKHHDRAAFEIFCYADSPISDDLTAEIKKHAEHWRPISALTDTEVAAQLRRDRIDIAVDLAGHFSNKRLALHALRPAPRHVHHVGFCGTTGLGAFDARLTDSIIEPPGAETDALSAEPLLRLPRGLHAHDPFDPLPPTAPPPSQKNGYITFGSFNAHAKLGEPVLSAWLEILRRTPAARLLIKNPELADTNLRKRLTAWFTDRGIAPERIETAGPSPQRADHLAAYNRIDLHLDSFPYNGVTTTCEALWMGVPVLTVRGHCHRGRIGESLLQSACEGAWVADNISTYITRAATWAGLLAQEGDDRSARRERIKHSPLANGERHSRAIEETLLKTLNFKDNLH